MTTPERFFDRVAARYDRTFAPDAASTARDLDALLSSRVPSVREAVVLDLGCGTGRAFPHLVARGYRVIGMDISLEMLREASKRSSAASVTRIRADLYRRWPLRDRSIDIVLALHSVLAHPPDRAAWSRVGAELRRVLVPNGFVAIDLPDPSWAREHMRGAGDRFVYEDRGSAIEAEIPDPAEVVRALGLPLRIVSGPLGVRAITGHA